MKNNFVVDYEINIIGSLGAYSIKPLKEAKEDLRVQAKKYSTNIYKTQVITW